LEIISNTETLHFDDTGAHLGTVYLCSVQNFYNITSLDAAQVNDITGQHLTFSRGLKKLFKNLKGIRQSNLKDFPKLVIIY